MVFLFFLIVFSLQISFIYGGPQTMNPRASNLGTKVHIAKEGQPLSEAQGVDPLDAALMKASSEGDVNKVKQSLAAGAKIECRDNSIGNTPLIWAAFHGHVDVMRCRSLGRERTKASVARRARTASSHVLPPSERQPA